MRLTSLTFFDINVTLSVTFLAGRTPGCSKGEETLEQWERRSQSDEAGDEDAHPNFGLQRTWPLCSVSILALISGVGFGPRSTGAKGLATPLKPSVKE